MQNDERLPGAEGRRREGLPVGTVFLVGVTKLSRSQTALMAEPL